MSNDNKHDNVITLEAVDIFNLKFGTDAYIIPFHYYNLAKY